MMIWCLEQLKYFIPNFSLNESFFAEKAFLSYFFFSFKWMCWWGCQQLNNLSRIKIRILFPSVSYIGSPTFMNHERLCQIIYIYMHINRCICLNHCWWCDHNQHWQVWRKAKSSKAFLHLDHPLYKMMWVFQSLVDYI